jgi:hypothetical protein
MSYCLDANVRLQAFLYTHDHRDHCLLNVQSRFVRHLLESCFKQKKLKYKLSTKRDKNCVYQLQFLEYEEIDWDEVLAGENRCRANCYCVRKGLTRKGAWAQVVNKW